MSTVLVFLAKNWKVFAIAALLAAVFFAGARYGGAGPRQELAEQKTAQARQIAEWERLRAAAAAEALRRQTDLQEAADAARMTLETNRRTIEAQATRITVLSADVDGMRGKLAAYAAPRSGQDTVAACQQRAGTLASLLAQGAGLVVEASNLARQCAIAHDERSAEVNAILDAWPVDRPRVQQLTDARAE